MIGEFRSRCFRGPQHRGWEWTEEGRVLCRYADAARSWKANARRTDAAYTALRLAVRVPGGEWSELPDAEPGSGHPYLVARLQIPESQSDDLRNASATTAALLYAAADRSFLQLSGSVGDRPQREVLGTGHSGRPAATCSARVSDPAEKNDRRSSRLLETCGRLSGSVRYRPQRGGQRPATTREFGDRPQLATGHSTPYRGISCPTRVRRRPRPLAVRRCWPRGRSRERRRASRARRSPGREPGRSAC